MRVIRVSTFLELSLRFTNKESAFRTSSRTQ